MSDDPADIDTEPSDIDVDTRANPGPLRALAGVSEGTRRLDVKPKADRPQKLAGVERMALQPIDPQTHGPQLPYGLRYSTHVNEPEQVKTSHDQVGCRLREPSTGTVIHTLTLPRGQTAMAAGHAAADATRFEFEATEGHAFWGICSAPFLAHAFRTVRFTIKVTANPGGGWPCDEDRGLMIRGHEEPFHPKGRHTLRQVAEPTPNPLARG